MALPPPSPNQAYWDVSVLDAGLLHLPDHIFVTGGSAARANICPSMSFLMRHSKKKNIKALFDLGIRRDIQAYPPAVQQYIQSTSKVDVPQDVIESLRQGGIQPRDISYVFLSHLHYDHIGNPSAFPNATFLVGNEGIHLLENGYPYNAKSHYSTTSLPPDRLIFLTPDDELSWKPVGPFPRANDIYKDGSMYVIDAPGHLPGHLNLLVRTSPRGSWVYLAGDSAHDPRILKGDKAIAIYKDESTGGTKCAHADLKMAEEHLSRVRQLLNATNADASLIEVVLSHDREWADRNRGAYFPSGKLHAQYQ
ncbi:Metallo-hydrolase/oxidoreductase [Kalaharituber pfeilii]|nr:Metallo-hydrolase/oxidoreductase [Kalaharituber pfeilii]